jgi:hypothetical protein
MSTLPRPPRHALNDSIVPQRVSVITVLKVAKGRGLVPEFKEELLETLTCAPF